MKKTILAAVITLATAPAMASINIHDSVDASGTANGVKVDVSGAAEVQIINEFKDESSIRLDDGDLQFDITMPVSAEFDAIATMAFEYEEQKTTNNELSVGLKTNTSTFTIGRQVTIADDSGIDEDYELGDAVEFNTTEGEQVAKFKYDNETVQFGISYLNTADIANKDVLDAMAGFKAGDFEGQIYYTNSENNSYDGGKLQAKYTIDQVTLAVSYSDFDLANDKDLKGYSLVSTFKVDNNTFALGYNFKDENNTDSSRVYGNVTHSFNNYVKTYAEVGFQDIENNDNAEDFGYVMGMEVKF